MTVLFLGSPLSTMPTLKLHMRTKNERKKEARKFGSERMRKRRRRRRTRGREAHRTDALLKVNQR